MKTSKSILAIFFCTFLILNSCRTEDDLAIDPPAEETIVANSTVANLLSRTAQNDGSFDNIIDNASCFSIELPVTVIANGTEIVVDSSSDYQTIEDIFDADTEDTDTLDIVFPITVVFANYTTAQVTSYPELLALVAQCPDENVEDEDIECIDILYPITASVFDENNELVDTITISNDNDLYHFVDDLEDYEAVTINFPIMVTLADGTTISINSIDQLEDVIEEAEDSCDEDDDNDYNDDDCDNCTTSDLESVLVNCTEWIVDDFEINDEDLDENYEGYVFTFQTDGSITVTESDTTFTGTWSASGSGNNINFVIDIPSLPDFNGSWNLHEIEQESGEVKVDFERGDDDELRFRSDC